MIQVGVSLCLNGWWTNDQGTGCYYIFQLLLVPLPLGFSSPHPDDGRILRSVPSVLLTEPVPLGTICVICWRFTALVGLLYAQKQYCTTPCRFKWDGGVTADPSIQSSTFFLTLPSVLRRRRWLLPFNLSSFSVLFTADRHAISQKYCRLSPEGEASQLCLKMRHLFFGLLGNLPF
jgi:hypothetical protein